MSLNFSFESGNKRAILLFHGLTGTPFEMKKYGKFLSANGFDVFADCLPGHGDLAKDIYTVKYEQWIDFGLKRLDELSEKYEEVFVAGLCLGAVLSLALAEIAPQKIKGVISLSTTLFLDGWRLPGYSFLLPFGLNTIFRYHYTYPECEPYGIKNLKTRKIIKGLLEKSDLSSDCFPICAVHELLKLSKSVRARLKEIKTPILIVHSKEDDLSGLRSAYCVNKGVSSKNKELIILQDSYHMVLYDNEKEFVFDRSLNFLNKLSSFSEVYANV